MCQRENSEGRSYDCTRHSSRRAWREIEDNRVGCEKLLVARSNKRGGKICGWM